MVKWNFLALRVKIFLYFLKKNFFLYFRKWNFLASKNLIKLFYALNKTPLWETGCLNNHYFSLAAQGPNFLIHLLWLTGHHTVPEVTILVSFFVTYMTPCHSRGQSSYLLQPLWLTGHHATPEVTTLISHPTSPRETEDFPKGGKYLKDVHLSTLLAYLQPV